MDESSNQIIEQVYSRVRINEGERIIEQILLDIYFTSGISTKELAKRSLLPLPLVSAIKKEFIKLDVLMQGKGVSCTAKGKDFVENVMGYKGLEYDLYSRLLDNKWEQEDLKNMQDELQQIFEERPQVDVTIDQSKSTVETSIKRAIYCLSHSTLIGKKIMCIGDDDFISVALGFLLKKIFPRKKLFTTQICVVDIDERIVNYINEVAIKYELPIECHQIDLRNPLPSKLADNFDCVFTDPPYTLNGLCLFLNRGIQSLKQKKNLPIFLSFMHKSPDELLDMQRKFNEFGIVIKSINTRFNEYIGAGIIGNTSQLMTLETTSAAKPLFNNFYSDRIYTGEFNRTVRSYQCNQCDNVLNVGSEQEFKTIEQLKNKGCPYCRHVTFKLIEKKKYSKVGIDLF
ncbi:bis-aminopropyl spermidine synthase family protein [Paenibacillus sp. NPDC057934]|uniref:bis-aminopropyl spermidine synthase family protein n=1 Tax=Paenibacillus sp. NPDC057934 TaxID=3346282 RepID=UPI0036DC46E4